MDYKRPKRITKNCKECGTKFRTYIDDNREYCDRCEYILLCHLILKKAATLPGKKESEK